jgi:hypothetical protein
MISPAAIPSAVGGAAPPQGEGCLSPCRVASHPPVWTGHTPIYNITCDPRLFFLSKPNRYYSITVMFQTGNSYQGVRINRPLTLLPVNNVSSPLTLDMMSNVSRSKLVVLCSNATAFERDTNSLMVQ